MFEKRCPKLSTLNIFSLKDIQEEVNYYQEKAKEYAPILNLYRDIFVVQADHFPFIKIESNLTEEKMKDLFSRGEFLLDYDGFNIESKLYKELLNDIIGAILKNSPVKPAGLEKLIGIEKLDEDNISFFLQKIKGKNKSQLEEILLENKFNERTGVNNEIISFVLQMALIPFYSSYARDSATKIDFDLWQKGLCPVCGQIPYMAKLNRNDGERILGCRLCRAEWSFPHIECPICRNKDPEFLHYFYAGDDTIHQVFVCGNCKGYIKTTDTQLMEKDVLLDLESVVTMHLDIKAVSEGFKPPEEVISFFH